MTTKRDPKPVATARMRWSVATSEAPRRPPDELFKQLAREWKDGTAATSSLSKVYFHPSYQQIIGLGPDVLPLIFRELRREPDWWFWALSAITGEDPVPADAAGDLRRMTAAWLEWEKRHRGTSPRG